MRRIAVLTLILTALSVVGSFGFLRAQTLSGHPFASTWCESPVVIPLASQGLDGVVVAAEGVSVARGAEVREGVFGPAIRLNDTGSRAQVNFGQTLFHTQLLFSGVTAGDAVRLDAFLGDAPQDLPATSISGALMPAAEPLTTGLLAEAIEQPIGTAEIDLFAGVSEVLFTNEGATPIELVAAIGCPAFQVETETTSAPTWDAQSQQFIVEHTVRFSNLLSTSQVRVLRSIDPSVASPIISNVGIDISTAAPGFSSAEISETRGSRDLERTLNNAFDGVTDTAFLSSPFRLDTSFPHEFSFTAGYTPDFNDPVWEDGGDVPFPDISFSGLVDDVPVNATASVGDSVTSRAVAVPQPSLTIEVEELEETSLASDGRVELAHFVTITNDGDTAVDTLTLDYPLVEMFGPGTVVEEVNALGTRSCTVPASESFNGAGQPTLLVDVDGMRTGQQCTVTVRSRVIPGDQPEADATDYETELTATARSGVRVTSDSVPLQATVTQDAAFEVEVLASEVTNLEDGGYQVDGTIVVDNVGALDLAAGQIAFDVRRPATVSGANEDSETEQDPTESAPVFFFDFVGDDTCVTGSAPGGARSSVFVSGGIGLGAGSSCEVEFSFVAFPGASLDDWTLTARVSTPATAIQPELALVGEESIAFAEAPAVTSSTEIESITNNGNGTYSVRSTVTVTNSGDVPLAGIDVDDNAEVIFGSQMIAHERIGDSCSFLSGSSPLRTAAVSPDANTCTVTTLSLIEPGADLVGDDIEFSVEAVSPSGAVVDTQSVTEVISFSESPEFSPSLIVESVERLDGETLAIVLFGSLENTGDVEARNVQLEVDLVPAFEQVDGDVDFDVQFISVQGLNRAEEFDGVRQRQVLTGTETVIVDSRVDFRVLIHAQPGDQPGPYEFEVTATAESPAGADFEVESATDETTVPLIALTSVSLESENNNDGTYSISHQLTVENAGAEQLPSIQVFTDFSNTFGSILLGVADINTTCESPVDAGAQCSVTQRATVRPGSAVGPYDVTVNLAATDASSVSAFTLPDRLDPSEVPSVDDVVLFNEEPSIDLESLVGNPRNNGDGTYDLTYFAEVTNTGDVPLYRVGVNNFVAETFGEAVASDQISGDGCSAVNFANPLEPGLSCEQTRTVTVRPLSNLGPWNSSLVVTADSPSAAVLDGELRFEPITFTEDVALQVESNLAEGTNNGDGTYTPVWTAEVTNTGDVPLIGLALSEVADGYGTTLIRSATVTDSCTAISPLQPLLPGAVCTVEQNHFISPGSELGPIDLTAQISVSSPSSATASAWTTTNEITLVENPEVELSSSVVSVESIEDNRLRVVQNLEFLNAGDVRVDDLTASIDLEELFGDLPFLLEGAVSNDFFISEAFTAGESVNILAEGQSLTVGSSGTITLVLSIEPGTEVGPFVGELRLEATSPAAAVVSSVITAQLDLPSVDVQVLAQSVQNNRDGSYTVTSSYEVVNDGTTQLEFLRLNEQLNTVYEGTDVSLVAVEGNGIPAADLEDSLRGNNLIEWGAGLPSGESAILTSTVIVEPGNNLGPFNPVVSVEAASPAGTVVTAEALSIEVIEFDEQPDLRVSQQLQGRPVWSEGRFEVTFEIEVANNGDVELRNLQVREDLLNALGAEARIVVTDIRSDTFVVNSNFDGLGQFPGQNADSESARDVGDTRLLGGLDTLAAESTGTIELDVIITPETRGVFSPRVVVSARTPAGADLGTGDEQIEASTLTRLSVQGELGVAKQVIGEPVLQPDGTVAVTYEILVENAGPFPLDNVAVHDQLTQAFGVGSAFQTSPVRIEPGSPCVGFASMSYDGGTVDPVLATGFALDPGERCRIQYDAVVEPANALPGPFRSSAFAIATDPFSGTVIDDSTDGTNADPDGNQEPGDNDIATAVEVEVVDPTLQLEIEPVSSSPLDGLGRYDVEFLITVENAGDLNVAPTRLIADLADQWDVRFEVVSLESETLRLNEDFDGDREANMIERGNQIGAGERAEILFTVRATRPDDGDLALSVDLRGVSSTGASVSGAPTEPAVAPDPDGALGESLFDTLTVEEQRLLVIGGAVILLFVALFVRYLVQAARRFRSGEPVTPAPAELPPGPGWSISTEALVEDDEVLIDLRDPLVSSSTEESSRDHHRSRRRRGRAPKRSADRL